MEPYTNLISNLPAVIPHDGILPVWQTKGLSTHEIARHISNYYGLKTSHTGTLDPLAQGVVIVLIGETRLKKYEYAAWPKVYEFEIVFGIQTDTFDGMGLITNSSFNCSISTSDITQVLNSFIGSYHQEVPKFSAIKVHGKPLHAHSRIGDNTVELPTRNGDIYELSLLKLDKVSSKDFINSLISDIKLVSGDFRQQIVISDWKRFEEKCQRVDFQRAHLKVKMSKGLYVRSLSQDICDKLNCFGIANNITRIANGIYIKDVSILC